MMRNDEVSDDGPLFDQQGERFSHRPRAQSLLVGIEPNNFLTFFIVTAVAYLPALLLTEAPTKRGDDIGLGLAAPFSACC